jgi:hypothetical protein
MAETKNYESKDTLNKETPENVNETKALIISKLIINDLKIRRGFDTVFPKISTDVYNSLILDIAIIIKKGM